ncbi:DUF2179 domain-containing protein [Bacillus cereus]
MLQALLIFVLQIIYVPILTIRTILLVKNQTRSAAGVGIVRRSYLHCQFRYCVSRFIKLMNIVAYVIGFSAGLLLGGYIENKLAIGYITYQVSLLDRCNELVDELRHSGFGVTVFEGEGINSIRYRLDIVAKRSREKELLEIINEIAPKAFMSSYEIRSFKGGYLTKAMKKRALMKKKDEHAS